MARYKFYSYDQQIMVPVNLHRQVIPGTFEYTLNTLIENKLDLTCFNARYKNEEEGASAYDPAILLKIILYAYSKGIISSRKIAELCKENIVCMALAADSQPHFTTIADFISTMDEACLELFTEIVAICYTENLIGKNMFAIDGCKISSNCSKEWSGTKAELLDKVEKIKKSVEYLITKHKASDKSPEAEADLEKEKKLLAKLAANAEKISRWLAENKEKVGAQGKPIKSNITDNDSAKMASSHGVIQGYNGVVAVDEKHQVIVYAQAFGDSNEAGHLPEIIDGVDALCKEAGIDADIFKQVQLTADSGYHSEKGMEKIFEDEIDAYIVG